MLELDITTPSLRLRHFVADDTATIMALNAEPTTGRWLPSHVYATPEDAAEAMRYLIGCYAEPGHPAKGPYVLAVEHLGSGTLLGHVGFSPLGADVEVSYAIAERARGQGLGAEALRRACEWVSEAFQLQRLVAITASANLASRRTLDRAGFEHVSDDTVRFQGTVQMVSRYVWTPVADGMAAA